MVVVVVVVVVEEEAAGGVVVDTSHCTLRLLLLLLLLLLRVSLLLRLESRCDGPGPGNERRLSDATTVVAVPVAVVVAPPALLSRLGRHISLRFVPGGS